MPDDLTRDAIRGALAEEESALLAAAVREAALTEAERRAVGSDALSLVKHVRAHEHGLLESLMAEYGLSNEEGLALMCLAEAYLRVPDSATVDALLRDKLTGHGWSRHVGHADSLLVNASTLGLLLSSQVLGDDRPDSAEGALRRLIRRAGEPMVRSAVGVAMRRMGEQFVLGRDIEEAWRRAAAAGPRLLYSFDMLGEAARTEADAQRYFEAYRHAILHVGDHADRAADVFDNPGVSVKLSALHPRYQASQRARLRDELLPRLLELARLAAAANIGLNVDAEEINRLELSLELMTGVLQAPGLRDWPGFGVVVQAYAKPARVVIDWCARQALARGSPLAVRLVKGAYWDAEIRHAQLLGLARYPVFTRKAGTDVAYLAAARRLFGHGSRLYPQFATHNAHTTCAVLAMAPADARFEFQRLHGMGEALHARLAERHGRPCRVYAPVGRHEDLLAYLVRRMLENGANASFVHQVHDSSVEPAELVRDPLEVLASLDSAANPLIPLPRDLYRPARGNSAGLDPEDPADLDALDAWLSPWAQACWQAGPMGPRLPVAPGDARAVRNPARAGEVVGHWRPADAAGVPAAVSVAQRGLREWSVLTPDRRAALLDAVSDAYEAHAGELLALLVREAGKHRADAVSELREAVDFSRYYAAQARGLQLPGRGVWACISPWNFPLAIFTGQIAAALAAGNTVVAKPAEQTPLVAARAVALMHAAGIPPDALLLLPGDGETVGAALVAEPRVAGVSFTGSLASAIAIDRAMAAQGNPGAPLIAETGGLNAMIVDSTALPEAAVRDIVASAFQSAGQRCSALRILLVQREIAPDLIAMLVGAMDALRVGDPWTTGPDIGPVIDDDARASIEAHVARHAAAGRLTHRVAAREGGDGHFVAPALIELPDLQALDREVFGPVLHWMTFDPAGIDTLVDQINAGGHGLTFGLHTRIDRRAQRITRRVAAGNLYVNRNQIGAVVGVQPFGGEGLSGTGPKAGGPFTLARLVQGRALELPPAFPAAGPARARPIAPWLDGMTGGRAFDDGLVAMRASARSGLDAPARLDLLERAFALGPERLLPRARIWLQQARALLGAPVTLPGPTGETNRLFLAPRGLALCLGGAGGDPNDLFDQVVRALACGNAVLLGGPAAGRVGAALLGALNAAGLEPGRAAFLSAEQCDALIDGATGPDLVLFEDDPATLGPLRRRLAARHGARVPVLRRTDALAMLCVERVVSVDTTASGGNAQLLTLAA